MTDSRQKGKRGEREAAAALRTIGLSARRGQQYNGAEGKDVISIDGLHVEVKRAERFSLYAAVGQAKNDAAADEVPIVLHRRSHSPWLFVVELTELPKLVKLLKDALCEDQPPRTNCKNSD